MLEKELLTKAPPSQINQVVTMLNNLAEDDPSPSTLHTKFYLYMKLGQYEKAHQSIDSLFNGLPPAHQKRCSVLHCKAIVLSSLDDMNGALHTIDDSLQINPEYAPGLAGRGIIRAKVGDLNGALQDLQRSLTIDPQNVEAYDQKAKLEKQVGQEENALKTLQQAKQLYFERARDMLKANNIESCLIDLSRAISIDEKFWPAHTLRAHVAFRLGFFEQAVEDLAKIISIEPTYEPANRLLAVIHWELGKREEALSILKQGLEVVQKENCFKILTTRAQYLKRLGRREEALDDLNKVLESQPSNHDAKNEKSTVLYELGRYEEALENLKTIDTTSKEVNKDQILYSFAMIHHKLGNTAEHIEAMEELWKINPTHSGAVAFKVDSMLTSMKTKCASHQVPASEIEKTLTEALEMLNAVIAKKTASSRIYQLKDRVLVILNRHKDIIDMLNELCQQKGSNIFFHQRRVDLLIEMHMVEEAQKAWEDEAKSFPQLKFIITNHHGRILMLKNKIPQAVQVFESIIPENEEEVNVISINLGTCYGQMGKAAEAIKFLSQVKKDYSQRHMADMLLAAALVMQQCWSEAVDAIEKINFRLLSKGENERLHMLRGMALMLLDREHEALKEYELAGEQEDINFYRGFCLLRMQNIPGAVRELSHQIKKNPKHDLSYFHRATCFALIQHFKEALLDLEREEALEFQHERSYLILRACIFLLTNRLEQCEKNIDIVENDYEKGNCPTLWPEYDEQLKSCLLKGSAMIRGLIKVVKADEKNHQPAYNFVMAFIQMMPQFIDSRVSSKLNELCQRAQIWAKSATMRISEANETSNGEVADKQ